MDKTSDPKYGIQDIPSTEHPPIMQKYWGSISTLHSDDNMCVKHIKMNAGEKSSLEYHCKKEEWYYVLSGELLVRMRIRRAENVNITLYPGSVYHIPVGLMHQRQALKDTEIIEWSNKDNDADSHIVEDGRQK